MRMKYRELLHCAYCDFYNGEDCEYDDEPKPKNQSDYCDNWEMISGESREENDA